jgi:allophanate hydrolase subunit 2
MLLVRKVVGLATVQDLGRAGLASHGVPRGGALVRTFLRRANAALGNDDGAACVEVFGRLSVVAESAVAVATERGDARQLRAGEELVVKPRADARARYLAIAGGVDAPVVLGSRSTLAACGIGGPLRPGDRIAPAAACGAARPPPPLAPSGPIAIIAGPDDLAVAPLLASSPWRVGAASSRAGTRLEGRSLAGRGSGVLPSSPMVPGAIQLPSGGTPIVIGPDGPTTGGYPIVAVIASADLDRFHALPVGADVAFEVHDRRP